jgi:hypothetical protein
LRVTVRALAIAALIVLAAYAFLPLRSAYVTAHHSDPTLALGIPPGRPFFDDHHPATLEGFRSLVTGAEWGTSGALARIFTPHAVHAALDRFGAEVSSDLPQGLLIAALIGIGFVVARAPLAGIALIVAAVVPALFGASYPAEADPERYVLALYALAALGVAVAADRAVRAFGRPRVAPALTVACALLALAVVHDLARGRELFAVRDDTAGTELGARVAAATRDGAVVVAQWDWATPLGYAAYVDRALGNRIVVCALPADHLDDYARWARERQVAIVADGEPTLSGYRTRRLSGGSPQIYEILPP